jgi:TonB-dependent receptor
MRKIIYSFFLVGILFNTLSPHSAAAQEGRGTVAGTVRDSANAVLTGALVEIQPTGKRAASDDQGQFRFTDVAAGQYTLTVSYVGLSEFTNTLTVNAGQTASVDAVLKVAGVTDQVMVTAERLEGQAEAINIERTDDHIVQVLPLKEITSLPNTNIADAVGRAPSVTLERDEGEGKYVQIRSMEPRLTNTTINGVNVPSVEGTVRNIKLDSVPTNLVERIEVFKTLSADMDADGIGGTVNLVTKTASSNKPAFDFGGSGGYTPIQGGRTLGEFDGTYGQRFGTQGKLGFLLGGTWDRNNRGINDLEPAPGTTTDPATGKSIAQFTTEDQRSYAYYRTRYGFDTGIDYNLSPGSNVYIKGMYSDFHDYGDVWVYTPNAGNTVKAVNGSTITYDNAQDCQAVNVAFDAANPTATPNPCSPGNYQYRHYVRRPDQQLYSVLIGARHDFGANLITYEFAGSRGHNIGGQDFMTTNFNGPTASYDSSGHLMPGPTGADLALNTSDPLRPKFVAQDGTNIYDPTQYTVSKTSLNSYIATTLNFQGAATYARRYSVHSHLSTFQMGVKVRNSHGYQHELDSNYNAGSTGLFTLSQVQGTYTNPTYYDGYFGGYGPTSDYNKILQAAQAGLISANNFQQLASVQKNEGAFFDSNERIYAGFVQDAITIGKFRFQAGVRFDGTKEDFTTHHVDATIVDGSGNLIVPASIPACPSATVSICSFNQTGSYFNALASAQVQYQIQPDTDLRAVYSRGLARPNIADLVPAETIDPNASPKQVTLGNASLIPTKSNNYDVLVEHFFQPLGILQAGFYYKQLYDPIYPTASLIGPTDPNFPNLGGYKLNQSVNGPNAYVYGFEAAWEQRFSFLPGLLSGFGVAANYGRAESQVTFPTNFSPSSPGGPGRIDHPTLPREAPNTWNLGFTYDKNRFSMRFGASHNDTSIFQYNYQHTDAATDADPILGIHGPTGDIYLYAHTQFDIQGSYRIYKNLSFFAYGLNLSNEVFGFYQGSPIYPIQREFYKPTVAFGMRWSSAVE